MLSFLAYFFRQRGLGGYVICTVCAFVQDYCKSNQPILLELDLYDSSYQL